VRTSSDAALSRRFPVWRWQGASGPPWFPPVPRAVMQRDNGSVWGCLHLACAKNHMSMCNTRVDETEDPKTGTYMYPLPIDTPGS
jgi:hypothetical protein